MKFAGNMVALVTPFRNGSVDVAALERLVDEQCGAASPPWCRAGPRRVADAVPRGARPVIAEVVRMAGGRVPVVAGTGSTPRTRRCR